MKNYGAIRKVMLIVLLSILGSYCIGADQADHGQDNWFESVMQATYDVAASVSLYCSQVWSKLTSNCAMMFGKQNDQDVKIQMLAPQNNKLKVDNGLYEDKTEDYRHGNDDYCTDGLAACKENDIFFNNTYYLYADKDGGMSGPGALEYDVDDDKTYDDWFTVGE